MLLALEGITNILLNLLRDPSPPPYPLMALHAFISERNAGFLLSLYSLQGSVRQGVITGSKIQGDCRVQALSLSGSHAYWACGPLGPSIMALGSPLDLSLSGIQFTNVELLVV